MDIAWMESKATSIVSFDMTYLPGLIQVPEYAEALIRAKNPQATGNEVSRWVDMRMKRQHVLTQHNPVKLSAIVDEHLIRTQVGDVPAWKRQLEFLLESTTRSNVELRLLPIGTCTGYEGPFQVFNLADPYPTVAYVATSAGDICVEGQPVQRLVTGYDRLLEMSLDPEASRKNIIAEKEKL